MASEQLEVINELYRTEGFSFIDPSFPPHSTKSLYTSDERDHGRCRACQRRNPLPPTPTEQEALKPAFDRPSASGRSRAPAAATRCT